MQLDLEELISLQGDTHANHSVKQVGDKAKKMNVISGQKCYELSKVANHDTLWLKMLLVMSQWASTRCLLTWKIKDTPQGRLLYQLVPKTHHIDETEFGSSDNLWPTPTSGRADQEMSPSQMKRNSLNLAQTVQVKEGLWPTPTASDVEGGVAKDVQTANGRFFRQNEKGEKWGVKLRDAVNHTEEKKLWPTPNASEARQGYQDRTKGKLGTQKSLSTEIIDSEGGRQATVGQLNSQWVTWLMGYPEGYLDISTENQTTSQELPKEKKTEPKS